MSLSRPRPTVWHRRGGYAALTPAGIGLFVAISLLATGSSASAQDSAAQKPVPIPGRIRGRVVSDSGRVPIVDAQVIVAASGLRVRTDSLGRYDLPNLTSGNVLVEVRAIGFRAETTTVEVRERRVINLELRMAFDDIAVVRAGAAPVQASGVPAPPVAKAEVPDSSGKMAEFYRRRQQGTGRFMARDDVAKWSGRRTVEMLDALGGLKVEHNGMQAWATNGRVGNPVCSVCQVTVADTLDPAVMTASARKACYMDVYVDGLAAYRSGIEPPEPLFDLNMLLPDGIEGVEVYSGVAQVPAKYNNRVGVGCGVILFWTRPPPEKKP